MTRPQRKLLIPLLIVLLLGGVELGRRYPVSALLSRSAYDEAALARLMALPMSTLGGEPRQLLDWKGKILVLNFWATWCPPCREEIPEFSLAQDQYGPKGVQFVGIALDDADKVAQFARTVPAAYPFLIAPEGTAGLTSQLGNQSQVLPFTIIVGRDGKQLSSHIGRLTDNQLRSHLERLL